MAEPIISWLGGKRRLADILIPRFPAHECYVEVFAGGAALYFLRPPAKVEVINDINGELINLYRVVQHHLEEFVRQFKWALTSRQVFEWLKQTVPESLTDIQRAARFYYLQKSCFGGKLEGQTFGTRTAAPPSLNLIRLEEDLSAAHLRLSGARSASIVTIARIRCSTWIRRISIRPVMALRSRLSNTRRWPSACGRSRAGRS